MAVRRRGALEATSCDWVNTTFPVGLKASDLHRRRRGRRRRWRTVVLGAREAGLRAEGRGGGRRRPCEHGAAHHPVRRSTRTGRSTCAAWTPCARASACGPTGSAIRWWSTSRKPTTMFADLMDRIKEDDRRPACSGPRPRPGAFESFLGLASADVRARRGVGHWASSGAPPRRRRAAAGPPPRSAPSAAMQAALQTRRPPPCAARRPRWAATIRARAAAARSTRSAAGPAADAPPFKCEPRMDTDEHRWKRRGGLSVGGIGKMVLCPQSFSSETSVCICVHPWFLH